MVSSGQILTVHSLFDKVFKVFLNCERETRSVFKPLSNSIDFLVVSNLVILASLNHEEIKVSFALLKSL